IGFIFLPSQSVQWWLTWYFFRPGKTGGGNALVNQSLLATMARAGGRAQAARAAWLPVAVGVAILGITGAALLSRAGHPVPGWVLCAVTGTLVSPISWDHHWVWAVAVLAMLAGLAMTAGPVARCIYLACLAFVAAVFGGWPQ